MGKQNTNTRNYETVVQLLVLAVAILAPYFAFNLMDLELFCVSKTMFITLWSSIKPWLCPPYVYLLINFIIFIIFASSFINYNTIFFNPSSNDHNQLLTNSFVESSSLVNPQNLEIGSFLDDDQLKFHTLEADTFEDCKEEEDIKFSKLENSRSDHDLKCNNNSDDTFEDLIDYEVGNRFKKVVPDSVVHDKRELRKSKTFHEGGSRLIGRTERYVRILSQDELDRQVEAFIQKCKNVQKSESNMGLELGSVY
uniref:uncharacterized protein LOC122587030 n=1 Tax=Erigeron canadensis TaxID=72917 RepID=UPI001CB95B47|nr:uncharacterized protein LOC122587030 [Erigeron canadensis]